MACVQKGTAFQPSTDYPAFIMVECNNEQERRLRIQLTLHRLVKATAELEALKHPPVTVHLAALAPRDQRLPPRKWDRL